MGREGIFVIAETQDGGRLTRTTLELMGLGRELAGGLGRELSAVLMFSAAEEAARELIDYGADIVFAADESDPGDYHPEVHLRLIRRLCEEEGPAIVLLGHTSIGQDLAPRLCSALSSSLVTDCLKVELDKDATLLCTKPIYGGNCLAEYACEVKPGIATIRAHVGEPPVPDPGRQGEIVRLLSDEDCRSRLKVLERVVEEDGGVKLEDAQIIISGGRGMGGPEGFQELRQLANLLNGAVGASRPACDSGWIPSSAQVGITGKIVSPNLYVAVGISGSNQHLSGMSGARRIVAINKDPEAHIFEIADYGLVADWKEVLPSLKGKLSELLEK